MTLASRFKQELEGFAKPLTALGASEMLAGLLARAARDWFAQRFSVAMLECVTKGEQARLEALWESMFGPRQTGDLLKAGKPPESQW